MERYSVVSGIFTDGAIRTCTGVAGALAAEALLAALLWQPDSNATAANASSNTAARRLETGPSVRVRIGTVRRISVYVALNLTTLINKSKIQKGYSY
jgi:hypothetical protein